MRTEFFRSDGHQELVRPSIDRSYIASMAWSTGKHWLILKYPPNMEYDILVSDDLENLKKTTETIISSDFVVAKSWSDEEEPKLCRGLVCPGRHDRDISDEQDQEHDSDGQMLCNDCKAYIYYCNLDDKYHHSSNQVAARGCFLIPAEVRAR